MDKQEFKSEQSNFSERLNHFIFKLELAHAKFDKKKKDKNNNEKTWSALYEYKIIIIN